MCIILGWGSEWFIGSFLIFFFFDLVINDILGSGVIVSLSFWIFMWMFLFKFIYIGYIVRS